jgi:small subunit ribosomal protein S13
MKLGSLTESDIQKLENVIRNPIKFGIYNWFLNRRKDTDTGQDLHLSGPDLEVVRRFDIQKMIDMKSYKGIRHMLGLPVRGQRTRSGFRKGRVVGVVRKTIRVLQEKGKEKKEEKK